MKLILENWRQYERYHDVFGNHIYITEFLGISLPLNESGHVVYTANLREQIIKEHLLLEGLFNSIKTYVQDKTAPLYHFMLLAYKSLKEKNSRLLDQLRLNIISMIITPLKHELNQILNKFKLGDIYKWIDTNIIKPAIAMEGFRGLLNVAGLGVFLRSGYKKLQDLIEAIKAEFPVPDQMLDAVKEAATNWIKNTFEEPWEKVKSIAGKVLDIRKWVDAIGPIVGGAATVASMLHPAVKGLATAGASNSPEEKLGYQHCYVKKICNVGRPTKVGQRAGQFAGTVSPEDCVVHGKECRDYRKKQATSFDE
jgi:hypothetical protein